VKEYLEYLFYGVLAGYLFIASIGAASNFIKNNDLCKLQIEKTALEIAKLKYEIKFYEEQDKALVDVE